MEGEGAHDPGDEHEHEHAAEGKDRQAGAGRRLARARAVIRERNEASGSVSVVVRMQSTVILSIERRENVCAKDRRGEETARAGRVRYRSITGQAEHRAQFAD